MPFKNYEEQFNLKGFKTIAGIDEVGRGSLFGDVVACAIIMPAGSDICGVNDSKKLTPKKRELLYDEILNEAMAVGIGRVNARKIDEVNIKVATHIAMQIAIENLRDKNGEKLYPDLVLIDAEKIDTKIIQQSIIKGDENCYSIACASIVAKVYRDNLCKRWAEDFPEYGIDRHKGYGTKYHREALKVYGPSKLHRISFLKNIKSW